MAAHARPFAGDVIAEPIFAKHVVLGARDIRRGGAGPHRGDAGLQRLAKDAEGAPLRRARLAHDQRAADLREIALDRGRQLGRHQIACGDAALRGRRHAENILAAGADDHEIVGAAAAAKKASISATSSYWRRPGPTALRKTA